MTPESEPSELVGQYSPGSTGCVAEWTDGAVTRAYRNGHCVILDNVQDAVPSVLERLNSVLETPCHLLLAEKGDVSPLEAHDHFRIFATMSTLDGVLPDISPALANRFALLRMPELPAADGKELLRELRSVATVLSEEHVDVEMIAGAAAAVWHLACEERQLREAGFSMRSIVRMIDCAYHIRRAHRTMSLRDSLLHSFDAVLAGQWAIKAPAVFSAICAGVVSSLGVPDGYKPSTPLDFSVYTGVVAGAGAGLAAHVLPRSRLRNAEAVAAAVLCNYPVLLEGPPAVGKTSLVDAMSRNAFGTHVQLRRVNNSDTTTVQDYVGSLLPLGGTFVYQRGELVKAMEEGSWFLADEFNLANPAVMSMLAPLLEGKRTVDIPNIGSRTAHPNFRFFATQNPATDTGRNRLPPALRSRFMEVNVTEFSREDLVEILHRRKDDAPLGIAPAASQLSVGEATMLAAAYFEVMKAVPEVRMTMRELVKWLRRKVMIPDSTLRSAGETLLLSRSEPESRQSQAIAAALTSAGFPVPVSTTRYASVVTDAACGSGVEFKDTAGRLLLSVPGDAVSLVHCSQIRHWPASLVRALCYMAYTSTAREPTLLVGPTGYKSTAVAAWASILGRRESLTTVHLTPETETADLIGQIVPMGSHGLLDDLVYYLGTVLARAKTLVSFSTAASRDTDVRTAVLRMETALGNLQTESQRWIASRQAWMRSACVDPRSASHTDANRTLESAEAEEDDIFAELLANVARVGIEAQDEDRASAIMEQSTLLMDAVNDPSPSDSTDVEQAPAAVTDELSRAAADNSDDDIWGNFLSGGEPATAAVLEAVDKTTSVHGTNSTATVTFPATIAVSHLPVPPSGLPFTADGEEHIYSASSAFDHQHLSAALKAALKEGGDAIAALLDTPVVVEDMCVLVCADKYFALRSAVSNSPPSATHFVFKDGPVTRAVRRGDLLLLENFDQASASVTERLNALLEPSPFFSVSEDFTISSGVVPCTGLPRSRTSDVVPLPGFAFFATVHREDASHPLRLSPAARSRLTEIVCPRYHEEEVWELVGVELQARLRPDERAYAPVVTRMLQDAFAQGGNEMLIEARRFPVDLHKVLVLVDFVVNHPPQLPVLDRVVAGIRFFWIDLWPLSASGRPAQSLIALLLRKHCGKSEETATALANALFTVPSSPQWHELLRASHSSGVNTLSCLFTGVSAAVKPLTGQPHLADDASVTNMLAGIAPTETMITNFSRLTAALTACVPVLLEGPPGVGKTAVVKHLSDILLGFGQCERVNMSASVTIDQLFGGVLPHVVNGQRVFAWRDGKLTSALREGKWVLLDELNLAPAPVLDAIAPLLERRSSGFTIPGLGETIPIHSRLFATMNPTSIGGNRVRLPRSIDGLFIKVVLGLYQPDELREIALTLFNEVLDRPTNLLHSESGDLALSGHWNFITEEQVERLLRLQETLVDRVSRRELGRSGGPFDFNLRDLIKFRDVLASNAVSLRSHFDFMVGGRVRTEDSDIRLFILRTVAELVYAQRFRSAAERATVIDLISGPHGAFPMSSTTKGMWQPRLF